MRISEEIQKILDGLEGHKVRVKIKANHPACFEGVVKKVLFTFGNYSPYTTNGLRWELTDDLVRWSDIESEILLMDERKEPDII
jgi:hypothetical protein